MAAPVEKADVVADLVVATPAALALIARLTVEYGPLMFHQSGGCCDGSAPLCFHQGELQVGDNDVLLGAIGGSPFYIGADQYSRWQHTQLIIDAGAGAAEGFSLEGLVDMHFITRGKVFSACEPPPDVPTRVNET